MELTITLSDQDARRILDLAWNGAHREGVPWRSDKKTLERFRQECESAKGMKL